METFESRMRIALRENVAVAVAVGVLTPVLIYFRKGAETDWPLAVGLSLFAAVGAFLAFSFRAFRLGRRTVEISAEGVRLRDRRGVREMAWSAIHEVSHSNLGGGRLILSPAEGRPLVVFLEGFTVSDAGRIATLMTEYHGAAQGAVTPAG